MSVLVPTKPWWKSKTIIANALVLTVAVLAAVSDTVTLPDRYAETVAAAIAVLNVILRFLTGQPVAGKHTELKEVETC